MSLDNSNMRKKIDIATIEALLIEVKALTINSKFKSLLNNTLENVMLVNEAKIIAQLVQINNQLGVSKELFLSTETNFSQDEVRHKVHDAIINILFETLDKDLKEKLPSTSTQIKEQLCLLHYGLHPQWLITKHLRPKTNITIAKGGYSLLLKTSTDDSNPSAKEPVDRRAQFFATRFKGKIDYKNDEDFKAIVQWMSQKNNMGSYLTVGIAKGGLRSIVEMSIDGLAVISFAGPLVKTADRSISSYLHGPGFLIFDSQIAKDNIAPATRRMWDLPIEFARILLPNHKEVDQLNEKLKEAVELGLLSTKRYNTVVANIKTYAEYNKELKLLTEENKSMPQSKDIPVIP
jgi:hypothetical protein